MKKVLCFVTFIFMVVMVLVGCSSGEKIEAPSISGITVEEVLGKARNVNVILHKEELENGILVFYVPDIKSDSKAKSTLSVEYLEKTAKGWELSYKGGGYSTGIDDLVYFEHLPDDNDRDTPLPLFYGEIKGSDIEELLVVELDTQVKKKAKIIKLERKPGKEDDIRLWYVTLDKTKSSEFTIKGMGSDGENLFSRRTNIDKIENTGSTTRVE